MLGSGSSALTQPLGPRENPGRCWGFPAWSAPGTEGADAGVGGSQRIPPAGEGPGQLRACPRGVGAGLDAQGSRAFRGVGGGTQPQRQALPLPLPHPSCSPAPTCPTARTTSLTAHPDTRPAGPWPRPDSASCLRGQGSVGRSETPDPGPEQPQQPMLSPRSWEPACPTAGAEGRGSAPVLSWKPEVGGVGGLESGRAGAPTSLPSFPLLGPVPGGPPTPGIVCTHCLPETPRTRPAPPQGGCSGEPAGRPGCLVQP